MILIPLGFEMNLDDTCNGRNLAEEKKNPFDMS